MKEDSNHLNFASRRRHEGGWNMMATLIGGAVVSVLAIGGSVLYNNYQEDLVAQGRGKQIGSGLDQLDAYARKYQTALTSGSSVAGVANPMAPTIAELKALGFAAGSFDDSAQPGGKLLFEIKKEPIGCAAAKCVLHLTAVTSGSVKSAGEVDQQLAGLIAGYVPNGAGWTNALNDPLNLVKKGVTLPNPRGSVPAVVAAKAWLGNSQASQTVPPPSYSYRNTSCTGGKVGHREQERVTTTDKWGNTTTGSWVTVGNYCTTPPPPDPPPAPTPAPEPSRPADAICWVDTWPNTYTCPAGTVGSHYSTTYRTCPGGPYAPDYTYEGPHTIDCHAPGASTPAPTPAPDPKPDPTPAPFVTCTEASWPNTYTCPAGTSGSWYSTSYQTCPNGAYGAPYSYEGPQTNTCKADPPKEDPKETIIIPKPDESPTVCGYEEVEEAWACRAGMTSTRIHANGYQVCYKGGTEVSRTATGGRLLLGTAYCDRITGQLLNTEYY